MTTTDAGPSSPVRDDERAIHNAAPTWEDFHRLQQRLEKKSACRDAWMFSVFIFSAVALLFGVIGLGVASTRSRSMQPAAAVSPAVTTTEPAVVAPSPDPVLLLDFRVLPGPTTIRAGQVNLQIKNGGAVQHELLVFRSDLPPSAYPTDDGDIVEDGPGVNLISDGENIDPGGTQTRSVDLTQPGKYLFVCNLHGHFQAGMYTEVTVR